MRSLTLLLVVGSAFAQTGIAPVTPTGTISGQVLNSVTKAPIANVDVSARIGSSPVNTKTDEQGHYTLKGILPGLRNVNAEMEMPNEFPISATRRVQMGAGQEITNIDFLLHVSPRIKGRVIDENKEPMPGVNVMLVTREYLHGALRYVFSGSAIADDEGNYEINRLLAGHAYLLVARVHAPHTEAISNLPDDPAMRKRVAEMTFYPGATAIEGAQALTLRDGEVREGIDIPLQRGPSFCMEGRVLAGTRAEVMNFQIAPEKPTYGQSGNGGMYGRAPINGKTGGDGAVRACGLTPGIYTVTVDEPAPGLDAPAFFGTAAISVKDSDLHDVVIAARPKIPVPIEVALDGPVPVLPSGTSPAPPAKLGLRFESLVHTAYFPELKDGQIEMPGSAMIDGAAVDDYFVTITRLTGGMYVKDVTYGGVSVLRGVVRVGNAPADASLRVLIGQDGAFVQAKATDKDNTPLADVPVTIFPVDAVTEADIAVTYVTAHTDQTGAWKSAALAPGKYYVMATTTDPDRSPEFIGKLLAMRTQIDPVEIGAGATVSVTAVQRASE